MLILIYMSRVDPFLKPFKAVSFTNVSSYSNGVLIVDSRSSLAIKTNADVSTDCLVCLGAGPGPPARVTGVTCFHKLTLLLPRPGFQKPPSPLLTID